MNGGGPQVGDLRLARTKTGTSDHIADEVVSLCGLPMVKRPPVTGTRGAALRTLKDKTSCRSCKRIAHKALFG